MAQTKVVNLRFTFSDNSTQDVSFNFDVPESGLPPILVNEAISLTADSQFRDALLAQLSLKAIPEKATRKVYNFTHDTTKGPAYITLLPVEGKGYYITASGILAVASSSTFSAFDKALSRFITLTAYVAIVNGNAQEPLYINKTVDIDLNPSNRFNRTNTIIRRNYEFDEVSPKYQDLYFRLGRTTNGVPSGNNAPVAFRQGNGAVWRWMLKYDEIFGVPYDNDMSRVTVEKVELIYVPCLADGAPVPFMTSIFIDNKSTDLAVRNNISISLYFPTIPTHNMFHQISSGGTVDRFIFRDIRRYGDNTGFDDVYRISNGSDFMNIRVWLGRGRSVASGWDSSAFKDGAI